MSVRAFSPEGAIPQVDYAAQAVKKGGLAVGLQCCDGVVLAVEVRKRSPLLIKASVNKVESIDSHVLCAVAGFVPDGKMLLSRAREVAVGHTFDYDEPISLEGLASQLSWVFLKFHGYSKGEDEEEEDSLKLSRPVGVGMLIAGWDMQGPGLWHLDPSGAHLQWKAKAIGGGAEAAEAELDSFDFKCGTCTEGVKAVMEAFRVALGDDFDEDSVHVSIVDEPPKAPGNPLHDSD